MKYVFFVAVLFLASSCSTTDAPQVVEPPVIYYAHTVSYPGETLGVISSWYTGKTNNWQVMSEHNPNIHVKRIQIGQSILIPQFLIKRGDTLPRNYVIRKRSAAQPSISAPAGRSHFVVDSPQRSFRPALRPASRNHVDWSEAGDYLYPDEM